MEKAEWKPFRNALDKKESKVFDDMWDIPRLYVSACSNSVQLVPLHPIIISILFHHYNELKECKTEVEQIEEGVSNKQVGRKRILTVKEEEEEQPSLDSYIINNALKPEHKVNDLLDDENDHIRMLK